MLTSLPSYTDSVSKHLATTTPPAALCSLHKPAHHILTQPQALQTCDCIHYPSRITLTSNRIPCTSYTRPSLQTRQILLLLTTQFPSFLTHYTLPAVGDRSGIDGGRSSVPLFKSASFLLGSHINHRKPYSLISQLAALPNAALADQPTLASTDKIILSSQTESPPPPVTV